MPRGTAERRWACARSGMRGGSLVTDLAAGNIGQGAERRALDRRRSTPCDRLLTRVGKCRWRCRVRGRMLACNA